ncbi:MAG TPA: GPP34 family phosphoprotein [Anaerolineaceae bacterium]
MKLTLAEELFLISLDDTSGKLRGDDYLAYGLAGAFLIDLAFLGKLFIDQKKNLHLQNMEMPDESLLVPVMTSLIEAKKEKKVTAWIYALSERKFSKKVPARLVERGIVKEEKKHWFWVIPYVAYPQQDASAKYWIKEKLRAIVQAGRTGDPRTVALLSLLKACRMLDLVFTRDERKAASKRIDQLVKDDLIGNEVAATIEEIESAASAAVIATSTLN